MQFWRRLRGQFVVEVDNSNKARRLRSDQVPPKDQRRWQRWKRWHRAKCWCSVRSRVAESWLNPLPAYAPPGFPVLPGFVTSHTSMTVIDTGDLHPKRGKSSPKFKWPCLKDCSIQCEKCDQNNDYNSVANQTISTITGPVQDCHSLKTVFACLSLNCGEEYP
jgi:hypothetical protein